MKFNFLYKPFNEVAFDLSFFSMLFTIIIGLGPAWGETPDLAEKSTSNIGNQIVYSLIFIVSLTILVKHRTEFLKLIWQEKYFSIFLLWCFFGIMWSTEKFMTFKAAFRILSMHLAIISFLLHYRSLSKFFNLIKLLLYSYILINLFAILLIPAAIDPMFGSWRGIMDQKNWLGQYSVVTFSLLFLVYDYTNNKNRSKTIFLIYILLSALLAIGSRSSTSISSLFVAVTIIVYFIIENKFALIGVNKAIRILALFIVLTLIFSIFYYSETIIYAFPSLFGKDMTFSGRTILWQIVLDYNKDRILTGGGLAAFWSPQNQLYINLADQLQWTANSGHSGYVDMIVDNGLIGISIFVFILFRFFSNSIKLQNQRYLVILVVVILVLNFQESTFMSPGRLPTLGIIISYWITEFKILISKENFITR